MASRRRIRVPRWSRAMDRAGGLTIVWLLAGVLPVELYVRFREPLGVTNLAIFLEGGIVVELVWLWARSAAGPQTGRIEQHQRTNPTLPKAPNGRGDQRSSDDYAPG